MVASSFLSAMGGSPGPFPLQASTGQEAYERSRVPEGQARGDGEGQAWVCESLKARHSSWQSKAETLGQDYLSFSSPASHSTVFL